MHKKFEINQTKIKGSCQCGRKVVTHNSKSDLPLGISYEKMDSNLKIVNAAAMCISSIFSHHGPD